MREGLVNARPPAQLIALQVALEYRVTGPGLIEHYPGSTERAAVAVYRRKDEYDIFVDIQLSEEIRIRVLALDPELAFTRPEELASVIGPGRSSRLTFSGEACAFSHVPSRSWFPKAQIVRPEHLASIQAEQPELAASLRPSVDSGNVVAGVFECGKLVSVCESVRENGSAAEAWVRTLPEHRRRGYALHAVASWAAELMKAGKVPFYSYESRNKASQALARKLGLEPFAQVRGFG